MASPDWVLDSLLGFLQSPFWNVTVNSFIDHNCVVFDPGEENKFTYTDIHREYAALVEEMLEGFVADFQITSDQFVDACARGLASDDIDEKLLEYVFAADDFLMFKSIMVKRNIELDLQVIDMVSRAQAARKPSLPQPQPEQVPAPAGSSKEEYDEEKVLQEVMKRSVTEFQQEETAIADSEMDRMLEAARLESIRLFEAMQAEEEQMARLLQATLALSQLTSKEGLHEGPSQTVAEVRAVVPGDQGEEPQGLKETTESKPELKSTHEPQAEEQPRSIWDACLSPPPVGGGASDDIDGGGHHTSGSVPGGGGGTSGGDGGGSGGGGGGGGTSGGGTSGGGSGGGGTSDGGGGGGGVTGKGVLNDHGQTFVSPQCVATETKTETAAAAWLESAKKDAEQESKVVTAPTPVDPDPENREAYWKLQKNRLLALKKEERTRQIQTTAAVAHGHKLSQTAEVAQKVVEDPTASSGSSSEREERRQVLLAALANRLKKEASDATQD